MRESEQSLGPGIDSGGLGREDFLRRDTAMHRRKWRMAW